MKRIFAIIASLAVLTHLVVPVSAADSAEVDRLEVSAAATAKVGEAIDLTVKALAQDGSVVKDYAGTIFVIVDNDNKAQVPYAEGYTFIAADQGQKTFSKGLSFTKEGTFKVVVSDFDKPKVEGSMKVKVGTGGGTAPSGTGATELVTITSPDNGSVLGSNNISIIGATKKNSKVQLFLNGAKASESQTDDKGSFMFQVKDVDQTENIFSVKVLDGSDKVIGESQKISVKIGSDGPAFRSIVLSEGAIMDGAASSSTNTDTYTAEAGANVSVTVTADPNLKEVSVSSDGAVSVLKEEAEGTYVGEITAPNNARTATIDVILKNNLGKTTTKTAIVVLDVVAPETPKAVFKNLKVETSGKKATFTFNVENEPTDLAKFEFAYSTGTGETKKTTTLEKEKMVSTGGTYQWYVGGLEMASYDFVISGIRADGTALSEVVSDPILVDMSLWSAGACVIPDVTGLTVETKKDVSILSWDAVAEAVSYNVYKKDSGGNFVLIENVPSNAYTVHIATGPVRYEDFSVKAVCADKTESVQYAPTTSVQTGPAQILFVIALALGFGYLVARRKKAV